MRPLEEIIKELNHVLNLGGKICDVKVVSDKLEIKYFDTETLKYETKLLTAQEAENTIDIIYSIYGLKRKIESL